MHCHPNSMGSKHLESKLRVIKEACQALADRIEDGEIKLAFENGRYITSENSGQRKRWPVTSKAHFESAKFHLLSKLWAFQTVEQLQMSLEVTRNKNVIFTANLPDASRQLKVIKDISNTRIIENSLAIPSTSRYHNFYFLRKI